MPLHERLTVVGGDVCDDAALDKLVPGAAMVVRDVWRGTEATGVTSSYRDAAVPAHGVTLLVITE